MLDTVVGSTYFFLFLREWKVVISVLAASQTAWIHQIFSRMLIVHVT